MILFLYELLFIPNCNRDEVEYSSTGIPEVGISLNDKYRILSTSFVL